MLANLDNEVHFKKVFTDVEVFTAFVKDVLRIDIHINKVETEKVLPSKVSAIKFKMDLFAEDINTRTIVEIQKVDYDYTYDRFSHYFLANLVDVQRKSDDYSFDQEVYVIVVVTSAYKISDITGKPIKKDVLITDINPRDLNGEIIRMTNHKMLILNPSYIQPNTPKDIADWLNLIKESMKNPENPNINTSKPAIVRAAKLAEKEKFTPEQVAEAKIQNMRKKAIAVGEKQAADEAAQEARKETKKQVTDEGIKNLLKMGVLTHKQIGDAFNVSIEYIEQLENEMKKNK